MYSTFIHAYNLMFSTNFGPEDRTRNTILEIMKRAKQTNEEASQIVFLFDFINESDIQKLFDSFNALLMELTESEEASAECNDYKETIRSFNSQYREKIEASLCLGASSRSKKFNSLI